MPAGRWAWYLRAEVDKSAARRIDSPMDEMQKTKTAIFNPISPFVVLLVGAMVLIEFVLQAGERGWIGGPEAVGWRLELVQNFGFHQAVFEHILQGGKVEPKVIWPFLSYIFVHPDFTTMLVASALLLGMGKMISDRFSGLAVLALFIGCGLAGALVFGWFSPKGGFPLIGAYPVFYGFIGTYTWIRIAELRAEGVSILPAFSAVAMFLVFRSVFALLYGLSSSWVADLAGVIVGFLLAYILAPDGKDRIRGWIRAARRRGT
ncbi:MAG: rhomboid family intramembrane serine protease [Rhodobacteraceae bacterium]|nr:rhomboid family intramembrane serine protease [Paracoccaceae bacterium]